MQVISRADGLIRTRFSARAVRELLHQPSGNSALKRAGVRPACRAKRHQCRKLLIGPAAGARLAAWRRPGADFPKPRPGRFFDGTRPAELLSRCALVIADLSLHPVSFRETFVTRLYRFSTVVSHSVPSSRAVSILRYRLSYLFALRRVWAGLSQRIICHKQNKASNR